VSWPASGLWRNASSLSALGYKDGLSEPAMRLWNEIHYLIASNEQEADDNNSASVEETQ
jgi:hypothetical protein